MGGRTVDEGANTQQEQLAAAVAKGPKILIFKKDVQCSMHYGVSGNLQ